MKFYSKINFTFNNDDLKSNQFEFYIKKLPKDKFDAVILKRFFEMGQ